MTGYASAAYAASLADWGEPRHLPRCDGWILERAIPGSEHADAMGPYPMFFCNDWRSVSEDLEAVAPELVSVVLVTDPFAPVEIVSLSTTFDSVTEFKDHFVTDLELPPETYVSKSHRAIARKALRSLDVTVCDRPWEHLDTWMALFANLTRRHAITGMRAFSRASFDAQLRVPGLVMVEASSGDDVVGLDLWYVQGDIAYGHLAAFSDRGYELGASYATKWTVLQHFAGRLSALDLGGTAGTGDPNDDGLAQFKAGWASGTRPVYLCRRVLQPDIYQELTRERDLQDATYFPAYRRGELA